MNRSLQITDGRDKPNKELLGSYFCQVPLRDLTTNGKLKFDSSNNDLQSSYGNSSGNYDDNNNNEYKCIYNNDNDDGNDNNSNNNTFFI